MAGVWGADGLTLAQWTWASVWFTVALSVKMNILLFLPALGIMMLRNIGIVRTALQMGIVVTMQVRCSVWLWVPHRDVLIDTRMCWWRRH